MTKPIVRPKKPRGRPRLSAEDVRGRVSGYCERYGVRPNPNGLPPFPAGQRETPQHRQWLSVYRAHQRLQRHSPVAEDLEAVLQSQDRRCPVCGEVVELVDASPHRGADGGVRAVLHLGCLKLTTLAHDAGPEALDRVRAYLWSND